MNFLRSYWPYLCAFTLLAAAVVFIYTPLTPGYPYPYDSADYMYAGQQGFWANYTDSGSLSLPELMEKGTELIRHPERRAEFSREIRQRQDVGFYRHYHGPMLAYGIALLHGMGIDDEAAVRNAGLVVLSATAFALMAAFWTLFPGWPPLAGLAAAGMLLFNRTGLITAFEVTQHILFMLTAVLALWALSLFSRTLSERWWYLSMASMALAFLAVETAILVAGTIAVMLLILWKPIAEKWPSPKTRIVLLLKGIGVFLLTILVLWPAGILKLSLARGFVYLAYIAIERKTFSSRGVVENWILQFRYSPFEHVLLAAGFVAAVILWRRFEYRRETLPWIVYAFVFIIITTKVTVEYVHYRGTIAVVWIMAVAMVAGYLLKHHDGLLVRVLLAAAILTGVTGEAVRYHQSLEARAAGDPPPSAGVVDYVRTARVPEGNVLYVPYYFVPALHFYYPDIRTAGYDRDWPTEKLVRELRAPDTAPEFLCVASVCQAVARTSGAALTSARQVAPRLDGQPLYVMETPR